MSQNLLKRIITSIILLSLLIFINFSHQYIFILSILILGMIICLEANNLFSKLLIQNIQKKTIIKKLTLNFYLKYNNFLLYFFYIL